MEPAQLKWRPLKYAAERAAFNPLLYVLSLDVGLDQSQDPEKLRGIFDRARARFPAYHPLYRRMLRILMPRWGGSYEKVDEFVNVMSNRSSSTPDLVLYARLYWMYAGLERDDINIFDDALANWPTMRAGFTRMTALYPRSDLVLNAFAKFACDGGDADAYAKLRPLLSKRLSATAWSQKVTVQSCDKKFAKAPQSPGVPTGR